MELAGWDTITAVRREAINDQLRADPHGLIGGFEFHGRAGLNGSRYAGTGTFAEWQLVTGGSGQLLRIRLPIATGEVCIFDIVDRAESDPPFDKIDLAQLDIVIDVSLQLLPTEDGAAENLVFDIRKAGRAGDASQPGVLTPIALNPHATAVERLGEEGIIFVLNGIANSLTADAGQLAHLFARLNLVPAEATSWLAPVRSDYCYTEFSDGSAFLSVLSATTDRDISGLTRTVDPQMLDHPLVELAFAMSGDLFLEHVVQPGLSDVFEGDADAGCFTFDSGRHQITLTRSFSLPDVDWGLFTYTPRVTHLSVRIAGSALQIQVEGYCDLKAGITMTYWVSSQSEFRFDPERQLISFSADSRPSFGHDVEIPEWWPDFIPLVKAITGVIVQLVSDSIAGRLNQQLASTGMSAWRAQPVAWPGLPAIDVESAGLDSSLYLRTVQRHRAVPLTHKTQGDL